MMMFLKSYTEHENCHDLAVIICISWENDWSPGVLLVVSLWNVWMVLRWLIYRKSVMMHYDDISEWERDFLLLFFAEANIIRYRKCVTLYFLCFHFLSLQFINDKGFIVPTRVYSSILIGFLQNEEISN